MAEFKTFVGTSPLQQLLEDINFQRTKEMRLLLKDDDGFIVLQGTTYWTDIFVRHFLFQSKSEQSIDCDDLLFFVRKKHVRSSSRTNPQYDTEIEVFRKDSRKLPIGDPSIDWEESVYLNLIIHQFDYSLTLAICTRTSPKELQILKKFSQKVFASPSKRKMDSKGDSEEITFPHICFMIDNFDQVMNENDITVRDGEMVCVELVASDKDGTVQGVIFLGSIRYDALKRVYDARQSSLSSKVAQRLSFGLFNSVGTTTRCEFVRMKGPQGKGHAEMAVTKPKDSGIETPTSEPGFCVTDIMDWGSSDDYDDDYYKHQRRLSDPSSNLNNFTRLGWRQKNASDTNSNSKARSENEGLDCLANEISEIEAGDLRDDRPASFDDEDVLSPSLQNANDKSAEVSSTGCCNCFATNKCMQDNLSSLQMSAEIYCPTCDTNSPACLNTMSKNLMLVNKNLLNVESEIEYVTSDKKRGKRNQCTHSLEKKFEMQEKSLKPTSRKGSMKNSSKQSEEYEFGSDLAAAFENSSDRNVAISKGKFFEVEINTDNMIRVNGKEEFPVQEKECKKKNNEKRSNKNTVAISFDNIKAFNDFIKQKETINRNITIDEINGNILKSSFFIKTKPVSTLPKMKKKKCNSDIKNIRTKLNVPTKFTSDGTKIYYWCDLPDRLIKELDDGAFNPLWTTKGFTQNFHFWKEKKRIESTPLNAFITYCELPWWSIAKDLLDHRETPILTF